MTDLILPPSLRGFERGTNEAHDVLTQTTDGADLNAMWREFQATIAINNRDMSRLVNMLTYPVSNPIERVMYPAGEDFEEASEYGEPKGIRGVTPFSLGYDFKWYDLAARYTWMFLAEATADELREINNMALDADNRLIFSRVMRAIFNPNNRTADILGNAYNVYALYNADGTVPPDYKTNTFDNTHTHYIASGATTLDSGDVATMETHLGHHGYRIGNGYRLVLMINPANSAAIRGATTGGGWKYTFLPLSGIGGGVIDPAGSAAVIGRPSASGIPGEIGTYGPFVVVEEEYIPSGYVLAFASGGERNLGNLVGFREHSNASLRGMRLVKGRENDYPLIDSFYQRGFGTGIRHRGAAVVTQLTTDGSYSAPTEYA